MGMKYYLQTFKQDRWREIVPPRDFENLAERMMYLDELYGTLKVPYRILTHMGKVAYQIEPEPEPDDELDESGHSFAFQLFNTIVYGFWLIVLITFIFVLGYGSGRVHQLRSLERHVNTGQNSDLVRDVRAILDGASK